MLYQILEQFDRKYGVKNLFDKKGSHADKLENFNKIVDAYYGLPQVAVAQFSKDLSAAVTTDAIASKSGKEVFTARNETLQKMVHFSINSSEAGGFFTDPNKANAHNMNAQNFVDDGYQKVFKVVPSVKEGEHYGDYSSIWAYKESKPGDPIQLAKMTGSDIYLKNVTHHAGASIRKEWIDDNQVTKIAEVLEAGRVQHEQYKAGLAYGTLFAPTYTEVIVGATKDIENRIKALNKAILQMIREKDDNKQKAYYSPTKMTRFPIVCPVELVPVWQAVLDSIPNSNYTGERLVSSIEIVGIETLSSASTDTYVFSPQVAHVQQERMGLERASDYKHMDFSYDYSYHARYNFATLAAGAGRKITGVV